MGFGVHNIGTTVAQFFSSTATARAVEAQAKVTGGALNTAAQSTVQTERDRSTRAREDRLLGRRPAIDAAAALEPTHTATGEDARSPTERRDFLYQRRRQQRRGGQGGGQQGENGGQGGHGQPGGGGPGRR